MINNTNAIWITWEEHRRSTELSKAFNSKLYVLTSPENNIIRRFIRYVVLSIKTLRVLYYNKPKIVFAQNPSVVLAMILSVWKSFFKYILIVDRHSNFKLENMDSKYFKWKMFHIISNYSIRRADITIVTNKFLSDIVNKLGGSGFILEDKLPEMCEGKKIKLPGEINIVFVSTFSDDEPIDEVIEAAKHIDDKWNIYITGKYHRYFSRKAIDINDLPNNIFLTGFLPESEYQTLLKSADVIIILTREEYLLNCGSYEGISIGKPIILSDTKTIRNYFNKGVIYTKSSDVDISKAIVNCVEHKDELERGIGILKNELTIDWEAKFEKLNNKIYGMLT